MQLLSTVGPIKNMRQASPATADCSSLKQMYCCTSLRFQTSNDHALIRKISNICRGPCCACCCLSDTLVHTRPAAVVPCAAAAAAAGRLITDRETGRPKGFGFCEFYDKATAESAHRNLNGHELHGRNIRIDFAEEFSLKVRGEWQKMGPEWQRHCGLQQKQGQQGILIDSCAV